MSYLVFLSEVNIAICIVYNSAISIKIIYLLLFNLILFSPEQISFEACILSILQTLLSVY